MGMLQSTRGKKIKVWAYFIKENVYYDPDSATITVEYQDETKKVDAQNMVKSETGKYYYEVQTAIDWAKGRYQVTINSTNPSDVTYEPRCFWLA